MKNHIVQVVDRARQGFKRTRSGSISASQVVLVPPELWLQIFSYLTTSGDLKAVSLTCTCFRQLAQPLLFSKISTHPCAAPLGAPMMTFPTDVLIDAIFDGLRKLPNLKVLGCQLAVLHGLALMTVTLESCPSDVVDFTHQPVLPLCSVTFKYHDPPSRDVFLAPLLSLFLAPRHLQRLSATTPEILLALTLRRPFARLTHLDLPPYLTPPPSSASPCTPTPTGAAAPTPRAPALPPLLLPHLKAYRGPRNYAALFAGTGRLSTVELSLPAKAHRLLRTFGQIQAQVQFQQSHTPVELDFLSFRVDGHVPPGFLQNVHTLLPALRTLSINDPAVAPASLQALLAETSPCPNIRMFRIRVEGRDRYNLWVPPVEEAVDAVECFNKVRAEIDRLLYGVEGGAVVWKRDAVTGQLVQVTVLQ
ncbi:hypothetical protein B0H14DRAFT_2963233 [Mycena olivaceomarginata]|nr:hypothetical protein B0H14DRAFT_2963233 [Mycena olivaceomarginata]